MKKTPLSRERVLGCALAMADEDGLDGLSMRKLADRLGVKAMSLYNHVANKDEIIDGLVEMVVAEMGLPDSSQPWRQAMEERAVRAHDVLMRHPWATHGFMSRVNAGPAMLAYVNATLGCLHEAGFSLPVADHAWNAMDNHIYGFTLQALNFPFSADEYAEVAKQYLPMINSDELPYLHQLTALVSRKQHKGVHDFRLGLGFILDGLASLLAE